MTEPLVDRASESLDVQIRAASDVRLVGWFPNHHREIWVEVLVNGQSILRRLELPTGGHFLA